MNSNISQLLEWVGFSLDHAATGETRECRGRLIKARLRWVLVGATSQDIDFLFQSHQRNGATKYNPSQPQSDTIRPIMILKITQNDRQLKNVGATNNPELIYIQGQLKFITFRCSHLKSTSCTEIVECSPLCPQLSGVP